MQKNLSSRAKVESPDHKPQGSVQSYADLLVSREKIYSPAKSHTPKRKKNSSRGRDLGCDTVVYQNPGDLCLSGDEWKT